MSIHIKNQEEINKMRKAGKVLAATLSHLHQFIKPGITTSYIDKIAEEFILNKGATPSFKGLYGFPNACCISVNDEVVHTIPNNKPLKSGDILTVDCGAYLNGFHSDSALTYFVGDVDQDTQDFVFLTRRVMQEACAMVKPGRKIGDISNHIQTQIQKKGHFIIKQLIGHGIGKEVHEEPEVPNFGKKGSGPTLKEGMTICIEPIVGYSSNKIIEHDDHWTLTTNDGGLACQEEHTILVTNSGFEILSLRDEETWLNS